MANRARARTSEAAVQQTQLVGQGSPSRRAPMSPIAENVSQFCFTQIKNQRLKLFLFLSRVTHKLYVKKRSKRKSSLNQTSSGRDNNSSCFLEPRGASVGCIVSLRAIRSRGCALWALATGGSLTVYLKSDGYKYTIEFLYGPKTRV